MWVKINNRVFLATYHDQAWNVLELELELDIDVDGSINHNLIFLCLLSVTDSSSTSECICDTCNCCDGIDELHPIVNQRDM